MALKVNVIYGGGVAETNVSVMLDTDTIRLSGGEAVLEELGDEIWLGTINLAELDRSQDIVLPITLPEGVTNETGITEVVAAVRFVGVSIREMAVSNIEVQNVPEGMDVNLITKKLNVIVRGSSAHLVNLTEEDIVVVVDFSEAEEGSSTFKATVQFAEEFQKMGAVGTYSVYAIVSAKEP